LRGSAPSIAPSSNDLRQELKLARFDRGSYATRRSSALPAPTLPPPCSLPLALRSEVERRSHGDFALRPAGSNGTAAHAPNGRPAADVPSWSLMAPCHCASDACPFRRPLCEWPLPDRTDRIGETEDEPDKQKAGFYKIKKSSAPECESPKPR
jgi:hypothetical protein